MTKYIAQDPFSEALEDSISRHLQRLVCGCPEETFLEFINEDMKVTAPSKDLDWTVTPAALRSALTHLKITASFIPPTKQDSAITLKDLEEIEDIRRALQGISTTLNDALYKLKRKIDP